MARLGGDEFMILLSQITHPRDAAKVSRRVLDVVSQPFHLAGHELFVTASIGVSLFPHDGEDLDNLLKNADAAMYHVKDQGRNDFQFYAQAMNASALERLSLENRLRKALEREEFVLHYQPQVDIETGRIVGAEALIRWRAPGAESVSPADFIPLAEETGLIVPIGEWVLSRACEQNKAWQHSGLRPVRVTVNLSSLQFSQKNLFEVISRALGNAGLEPKFLELEITESSLMQNAPSTIETLRKLKAAGFRIAVDDFGTGYSSLSYLKRFPLDVLKIDRSFVSNITTDPDDAAIATAIIAMGRSLNLNVIAEGVETEEQLDFLKARGCNEIQGYLFSPPVPPERFEELLKNEARISTGLE
ncbi:MAG: bifunctional diguanylate cyclase/phosphodiesterase [Syntrophobacteraceae bacterium]|nr:bifunctional diguanylate cyclase/phosphodiesterase [Syntrophobacteraceae bacterium]